MAQAEAAFKVFSIAMVVCLTISIVLSELLVTMDASNDYDMIMPNETYLAIFLSRILWHFIYVILLTAVLFKLRGYIRKRYAIPGNCLVDCCCSFWCPCLVLTQMMRHTTKYDVYPSVCCSETGVSPHAPEIV